MHKGPLNEKVPAQAKTPGTIRTFEAAWTLLEKRHAWRIREEEVHNPEIAISHLPYAWQDYDNVRAAAFRERHRLEELVADTTEDWEALLRLRHWAYTHLRQGSPSFPVPANDPAAFVEASLAGATFYCTYFAYAFVGAAAALGYPARHLGIDCEHSSDENSTHHGIADIWVNRFRKWVAFDVHHDAHHELDGVPLNAEELGQHWRCEHGEGIRTFSGPRCDEVPRAYRGRPDKHESCAYYWHYIDCENDVFHIRGQHGYNPVVFLVDEERKARVWYQGAPPNTSKHGRYANGSFVTTERYADAYPDLHCTRLVIAPPSKSGPYRCPVGFGVTCVPNYSHHNVRVDNERPERFDGMEYPWRLKPGKNILEVCAVNRAGHTGPPSRIALSIEADPSRKREWLS